MRYLKWAIRVLVGVLVLWVLLLFLYFLSMSVSKDSPILISYKTKALPYASLNALGRSEKYKDIILEAMRDFANRNEMDIDYGSRFQTEALYLTLTRNDIRVKIVNFDENDGFLRVFLYKESDWKDLSEKEHRLFFDDLIEEFGNLNLEVTDIKFKNK